MSASGQTLPIVWLSGKAVHYGLNGIGLVGLGFEFELHPAIAPQQFVEPLGSITRLVEPKACFRLHKCVFSLYYCRKKSLNRGLT